GRARKNIRPKEGHRAVALTSQDLRGRHVNPWSRAHPQSPPHVSVESHIVAGMRGTAAIEELELDERSARDETLASLDAGDDLFGIDRLPGGPGRTRIDQCKRPWVACPLVLDAMRVARSRRRHPSTVVQDGKPVLEHVLGQLSSTELVTVVHLQRIEPRM